MGLLPCVEVAWVFALEIKFSNSILSENAARRGEHRLTLWYIFLSGWRINDSAKTMTPLRESPGGSRGQPGQLGLRKEVSIIIGCAGRKAMTYTDLLGIGGLIDSQGEYVDAYWRMGTWFETFV